MSKKTIYLDMDGVISDFDTEYNRLRQHYQHADTWKFFSKMVKEENLFERLQFMPQGNLLLNYIKSMAPKYKFSLKILTSAGDKSMEAHYVEAKTQKTVWLKKHNIKVDEIIVVPQKELKMHYADANSLLIDDTASNVHEFIEAGGKAVLHEDTDIDKTLVAIRNFLTQ